MNFAEHLKEIKKMDDSSRYMSTLSLVVEKKRELSELEKAMLQAHLDNAHILREFIEWAESQMKLD